jgi:uncharacterized protein (TIGR02145 family)
MSETCPVCKTECSDGATVCSICGFKDELGINRTWAIKEDFSNWLETVVKPHRAVWEARKREAELLTQLETAKKRESELLAQLNTAKSNAIIQSSSASTTFTDPRDGKVYRTVKIGNQVWMAENLNYEVKEGKGLFGIFRSKDSKEGCKCYDNDPKNGETYGRLYDWNTAMKVAPPGWHLPSNEEWDKLYRFADGTSGKKSPYKSEIAGKYLKAKSGWNDYEGKSGNGEDKFGFSALPGGDGSFGDFSLVGIIGLWWSSSENDSSRAYYRGMDYIYESAYYIISDKSNLYSVRCLQDYW